MRVFARSGRARRGSEGATVVEFAIIASVLFLLLFTMLDLGIIEIGNSAASNAAREGARVGIINFDNADCHLACAANDNASKIKGAVNARIAGLATGSLAVAIRCLDGSTTDQSYPSSATKTCDSSIQPGVDLIEVTASWTQTGSSPFVKTVNHKEVARMVITGPPGTGSSPTTTAPGICTVSSVTFNPTVNTIDNASHLNAAEVVTAVTNNDPSCSGIQARFNTSVSPANLTQTMAIVGTGPNYTTTVAKATATWADDNPANASHPHQDVDILGQNGVTVLFLDAEFDIGGCTVSGVSFNPVATSGSPAPIDSSSHLTGTEVVTAATNGDSACAGIKARFNTPNPTFTQTMSIVGAGPNYSYTLPAGAGGGTWSNANPQTVDILASDGTTVLLLGAQFFVQPPTSPPTITSCAPNVGKGATTNVTITGTNFVAGATVTFSPTGGFTINGSPTVTSTQITVNVTAGNGSVKGTYDVTVTLPGSGGSVTKTGCIQIV